MFGKNKVITPKFFENEPKETLIVTSIFFTLQGEGLYSGRQCVFVRLAHCNLKCIFCDTFFDAGDTLSFDEIKKRIKKATNDFYQKLGIKFPVLYMQKPFVVITGGEPLNQPNLTAFLSFLHAEGFDVQIESNGLIERTLPDRTVLCISPKVNENTKQFIKISPDMLRRANFLKFVISATEKGYQDIPEFALEWRRNKEDLNTEGRIYVSPMNIYTRQPIKLGADGTLEGRSEVDERISFWDPGLLDMKANQANHEHAALISLKHRAYLTLQTHLMASLP